MVGSVVAGAVGGALAIHKNKGRKDERETATQRVCFQYFGRQGVKEALGGMQTEEIVELGKALDTVNSFEGKVNSIRREALQSIVLSVLGVDYDDFLTKLLTIYDTEAEILNTNYSRLIEDYYLATGENIDSDDNDELLRALHESYNYRNSVARDVGLKPERDIFGSTPCGADIFAFEDDMFSGAELKTEKDADAFAVEDDKWEDDLETEDTLVEPDKGDFINTPE